MILDLTSVSYSVLVGLFYAGLGYLKNRGREDFEAKKFLRTVAVGAVVGLVAPYIGLDLANFESVATTTGIIVLLQTILQAMVRKR